MPYERIMNFFMGYLVPALVLLFPDHPRGGGSGTVRFIGERIRLARYLRIQELLREDEQQIADQVDRPPITLVRRPRRLTEDYITSHLRHTSYNHVQGQDSVQECNICREPLSDGQCMGELDCECRLYFYHFECLRRWLMQSNTCPSCRNQAIATNDL